MKAKILPILIVAILVSSGFGMAISDDIKKGNEKIKKVEMNFSRPEIVDQGEFVKVKMEGTGYTSEAGKPMLPTHTFTEKFPIGTKIIDVKCVHSPIKSMKIEKKIEVAPEPIPVGLMKVTNNEPIEEPENPFPSEWYDYRIGCGIDNGKRIFFLNIRFHPVKYLPSGELQFVDHAKIIITYEEPSHPITYNDEYDLVIIAPSKFSGEIQPLIDHKNSHDMKTILKTTEEIYDEYEGRDQPEKIKYFIKDAIEEWGIKYVMLVGGKKSLLFGNWGMDGPKKSNDNLWYVPVRYSNLDDMAEKGYISDLYYADIYKYEDGEKVFDDWDSNENGVFAEWSFHGKDILDLYPDVYVGRLACRNTQEVKIMVNKIINYESTPADPSWFNTVTLIAGDTFPGEDDPYYEGELETSHGFSFMPEQFNDVRLFTSEGTLTKGGRTGKLASQFAWLNVVIPTINQGCGFLYLAGHASPTSEVTHHPHNGEYYVNILNTYNMDLISNGEKLPVCIVGGCHNSEFNISFFDFIKNKWTYSPTFECWSWRLTVLKGGGAIATIGNTGLGYGSIGDSNGDGIPDCIQYVGGFIESNFSYAYGVQGKDILGETWGQAVTNYINTFECNKDRIDRKTVEEWALLGDPSLQIGGYG